MPTYIVCGGGGGLCLSFFWYVLLYVLYSVAIILTRKRQLVAFFFIVLWMSCYYKCPVALPHGAMDWSAACDCGIFYSYSLTFLVLVHVYAQFVIGPVKEK